MGIRGLTSFIAKNPDHYFDTFELHDCSLIVDGNSLSSLLYNLYSRCVCAFGGDYDKYAQCVASFFISLKKTGVKPLVIFDGGYETRKLKTVMKRLKSKIRLAKSVTPISSKNKFFPLLMKEVFKDVMLDLAIPLAQCFFEADDEIAAIARQLNCPVLSYDSDFFAYDVFYIPFTTLDIKPIRREVKIVQNSDFFISCQIYNVENFLSQFGGLKKSMVPLLATLLGNDYIDRSKFKRFYASLKRGKRTSVGVTQRRISAILRWLKQWDDVDKAVVAVLSFLKKEHQRQIGTIIRQTVAGYSRCSSQLLPILGLSADMPPETLMVIRGNSHLNDNFDNESDEASENETLNASDDSGESADENNDEQQESFDALQEDGESDIDDGQEEVEEGDDDDDDEEDNDEGDDNEEDKEQYEERENILKDKGLKADAKVYINRAYLSVERLPSWFKELFCRGLLPSYFIDMLTLHAYFCSPQVEDYLLPSSHEISLPILTAIYSIIAPSQTQSKSLAYYVRNKRCQPQKSYLMPLDRVYPTLNMLGDMTISDKRSILMTSLSLSNEADSSVIDCFPADWRLFIACIVSWGRTCHSPMISNCHIHAVLFTMVALSVIDKKAGYHRTKLSKAFSSQVSKIIEARKLESQVSKEHQSECTLEEALGNISQDDCMILAEKVLHFHQIDDKLRGNLKLYSVKTVHAFAQLQSILFHAIHLNGLLNFPLPQCHPAKMFSGTPVYNTYANFKKRSDVSGYINLILGPGRSVCELYKKLSLQVFEMLAEVNVLRRKGNKRRKKPQEKDTFDSDDDPTPVAEEKAADTTYCDISNKFYALKLLKENDRD